MLALYTQLNRPDHASSALAKNCRLELIEELGGPYRDGEGHERARRSPETPSRGDGSRKPTGSSMSAFDVIS